MSGSLWVLKDIFGLRQPANTSVSPPAVGEVYAYQPDYGPVEYAEVLGVYREAADIDHVRFRLYYGYQDKTADLGQRTLAASLFYRRFTRQIRTTDAAAE